VDGYDISCGVTKKISENARLKRLAKLLGKVSFISMKIYRDHINMFLSELGYSELVQRLFEKMTFFRVDPLVRLDIVVVLRQHPSRVQ
jgi:hypothetical protein